MVILILNWRDPKNPKAGGAEIVTLEHAKGWINAGNKVLWFSTYFSNELKYENFQGIQIIRQGTIITVYLKALMYYLKNKDTIDIVIDEIHGLPFFTPLYVKKPKIAYINEVAGVIWDYMYPFPINKLGKFIESFLLGFYKNIPIITGSESAQNDLIHRGFKKENISVIHHGIYIHELSNSIKKESTPTFIFLNRLVKMKGIEDILKAFALIQKRLENAKLWIVGKGNDRYIYKLKELAKKLEIENNTHFLGFVEEIEKLSLLKRAHVLLHASVKEGWGLNIIEAASQGTPSVVYRVGGLIDSVKDGKTGIIVESNTPIALAESAMTLVQNHDLYKRLCEGSLQWSKKFSWKQSVAKSLQLLEENT